MVIHNLVQIDPGLLVINKKLSDYFTAIVFP